MKAEKKPKYRVCPYLGLRSDPVTSYSFPSEVNCCYHVKPAGSIDLEHQGAFCQATRYLECPEYSREPDAPLPVPAFHTRRRSPHQRHRYIKWIWAIFLLSLLFLATWQVLDRWQDTAPTLAVSTAVEKTTETRLEPTATSSSSPLTVAQTHPATPKDTATPVVPLGLETPLGIDHQFIIHQIQSGESLELIARQHGTSVEALKACNFRLPVPLLVGWAIVIPLETAEIRSLPAFEVYGVTEEVSMDELAVRLGVDQAEFQYYNGFIDGIILKAGDWVLVPRMGSPTP